MASGEEVQGTVLAAVSRLKLVPADETATRPPAPNAQ